MPDELTPGVYVEEFQSGPRDIEGVSTIVAFIGLALEGPANEPVTINNFDEFEMTFGKPWPESHLGYAVRDFFHNGGSQALIVRLVHEEPGSPCQLPKETLGSQLGITGANFAAALTLADFVGPGKKEAQQGLYALEKAGLFNLLNIPPYNKDADVDPELMAAAAAYCEERRAFLIIDPPSQWQASRDFEAAVNINQIGTTSPNAAIYFPRLQATDPLIDHPMETFPPGGAVAGVFARNDAAWGVWKAPANLEIIGAASLNPPLTKEEGDWLNSLKINCIRSFPGRSAVIWGTRTLSSETEWRYIPVRRMALFLEESISRGLQWAVFEASSEPLWGQIRFQVAAFLHDLWRRGAFQGQTPERAFFVKCDRENNGQNEIDLGLVNLEFGFTPLKPAEFFIIRLQIKTGQTKP